MLPFRRCILFPYIDSKWAVWLSVHVCVGFGPTVPQGNGGDWCPFRAEGNNQQENATRNYHRLHIVPLDPEDRCSTYLWNPRKNAQFLKVQRTKSKMNILVKYRKNLECLIKLCFSRDSSQSISSLSNPSWQVAFYFYLGSAATLLVSNATES